MSQWQIMQLSFPAPEISTYNKLTKLGKPAARKKCRRCLQFKDGDGRGTGHGLYRCADGLPLWYRLPFPISGCGHLIVTTTQLNGRPALNGDQCVRAFKTALDMRNEDRDLKVHNLLRFEHLARLDLTQSIEEAISLGPAAYDFSATRFT